MEYEVFSCEEFSIFMVRETIPIGFSLRSSPLKNCVLRSRISEKLEEVMYLTKKEK